MRGLLHRIKAMETEMQEAEQQADYWMEEEHLDEVKAEQYEQQADEIYERLYRLFDQTAEMIVSITAGQIDKAMAMTMIRIRRSEVEKIFL